MGLTCWYKYSVAHHGLYPLPHFPYVSDVSAYTQAFDKVGKNSFFTEGGIFSDSPPFYLDFFSRNIDS
jgi:hypothetical protein